MSKALQLILEEARKREMKNGDKSASEITKREYFAAKALQGLLAFPGLIAGNDNPSTKFVCERAVKYADSMMEALENSNQ